MLRVVLPSIPHDSIHALRPPTIGTITHGETNRSRSFIKGACATELGLQVHEFHQTKDPLKPDYELEGSDLTGEQVDSLIQYVRSLPRPEQVLPENYEEKQEIIQGEQLFTAVGCAECHVSNVGTLKGVYSDFLLHDMGRLFEDPIPAEPLPEITISENMDVISGYHGMVRRKPHVVVHPLGVHDLLALAKDNVAFQVEFRLS